MRNRRAGVPLHTTALTSKHRAGRLDLADRSAEQQSMAGDVDPLVRALVAALRAPTTELFEIGDPFTHAPDRALPDLVEEFVVLFVEPLVQRRIGAFHPSSLTAAASYSRNWCES